MAILKAGSTVGGKLIADKEYVDAEISTIDIPDVDISSKVDKVAGKQLSTEDYTVVEKTKLASVETGANKYIRLQTLRLQQAHKLGLQKH